MENIKISLSMIAGIAITAVMVTSATLAAIIGGGVLHIIPSAMAAPSDQGCSKSDFFNKDFHGPHSGFNRECFVSDPRSPFDAFPSSHGKSIPDCQTVSSNPNSDPGNFKCKHYGPGLASDSASLTCPEGTHADLSSKPLRCIPN